MNVNPLPVPLPRSEESAAGPRDPCVERVLQPPRGPPARPAFCPRAVAHSSLRAGWEAPSGSALSLSSSGPAGQAASGHGWPIKAETCDHTESVSWLSHRSCHGEAGDRYHQASSSPELPWQLISTSVTSSLAVSGSSGSAAPLSTCLSVRRWLRTAPPRSPEARGPVCQQLLSVCFWKERRRPRVSARSSHLWLDTLSCFRGALGGPLAPLSSLPPLPHSMGILSRSALLQMPIQDLWHCSPSCPPSRGPGHDLAILCSGHSGLSVFLEVTATSLTPSLDIKEQTLPGALLGIW